MSVWLSYSLSDFLLFSPRTYYRLFELYNLAVWPLQVVVLAFGLAIIALWLFGASWRGRAAAAILAAGWLWVAYGYHLVRYDSINWAAKYYAAGFALQALLLALAGVARNRLALPRSTGIAGWVGFAIFAFALAVQPLAAPLSARPWTQVELFGLAPDPTAVATLGILAAARAPVWLFILPALWCALSGAMLWTMGSPDALVTPAAGLLAIVLAVWAARRTSV